VAILWRCGRIVDRAVHERRGAMKIEIRKVEAIKATANGPH
jgi:hypothetical protein